MSHAARVTRGNGYEVLDPARMLALAVISQACDDRWRAPATMDPFDIAFWAALADVPETWVAAAVA